MPSVAQIVEIAINKNAKLITKALSRLSYAMDKDPHRKNHSAPSSLARTALANASTHPTKALKPNKCRIVN